jgi:outer membrane protein assembly factor BamE (lipoprotein component of BamABCDE complex)
MGLPRVQFTVRQMMVGVAVVALCCTATERLIHGFEDAVYAEAYSESNFLSLQNGMTKRQVQVIMGEPIRKYPGHRSLGPRLLDFALSIDEPLYRR